MEDIIRLYEEVDMLGPGGREYTERALDMLDKPTGDMEVLDLGCGTGASTFVLAERVDRVTAVDFFDEFLEKIRERAKREEIQNIETVQGSMEDLGFLDKRYDLIWSEGAIYNIGFRNGLRIWREGLREDGFLVVSELVWTGREISEEAREYWRENYPEVGSIEEKRKVIEEEGYDLLGDFTLPESAWTDYYEGVTKRLDDLEGKGLHLAKELVDECREEAEFYRRNKDYYSYAFFIMKKR